jgi:hypothetical protein
VRNYAIYDWELISTRRQPCETPSGIRQHPAKQLTKVEAGDA